MLVETFERLPHALGKRRGEEEGFERREICPHAC